MNDKNELCQEFIDSGLLWFINGILHLFGWVVVVEGDNDIYFDKTEFRGFPIETNNMGYKKLTKYMHENSEKWHTILEQEK